MKVLQALSGLQDGYQALVSDDVQQLQGWPGGPGVALFPLAHRRGRRMQEVRENGLAELQFLAQSLDVVRAELSHRRRADRVELPHRHFADSTSLLQLGEFAAQGFNELTGHDAPLSPARHRAKSLRFKMLIGEVVSKNDTRNGHVLVIGSVSRCVSPGSNSAYSNC